MSETPHVEGLERVPLFRAWTSEQMRCLQRSEEFTVPVGERFVEEGKPAEFFYVLLDGEVRITKKAGGLESEINTYRPGTFFGELPLLLGSGYVASAYAALPCRLLRLSPDAFWHLLSHCPSASREILGMMAQRVQHLESMSQERERLVAMGTLAAGLAHEMNNPASAGSRASGTLQDALARHRAMARSLRTKLTSAQWDALEALEPSGPPSGLSDTLGRADNEESVAAWIEAQGIPDAWKLAPMLAEAGWNPARLSQAAGAVPQEVLADALGWLEAEATVRSAVATVDSSTQRISEMISAIKEYTFLDQAPTQLVDVRQGLENTLTVLGYRLGEAQIARDYDTSLPPIPAYGSELNQLWTHLITNALDAAGPDGCLSVRTAREGDHVLVEIRDNGPGIPPDVLPRIFEPFFTTKGVGKGTGLGLDIARRIIAKHGGNVQVRSRPGDTLFQVRLPLTAARA